MDVLEKIEQIGIIPVIAIDDADKAVPLAKALEEGGLPAAEVTFRTAAGAEAIRRIAESCPNVLVGAGTVLNLQQCDQALAAGAKFIVSPGYNQELVHYCTKRGVVVLPGCTNASDLTKAVNDGLSVVKFFPAQQAGGIDSIKALAPVFPNLRFMPTGGINTGNVTEYLAFEKIIACGGTWMLKKELINEGRWDEITAICREAVKTMLNFQLVHLGIHCGSAETAEQTAKLFEKVFGFSYKPGNSSDFAGTAVECVKDVPLPGEKGHIAIGTRSVKRAEAYLKQLGFGFLEETRKLGPAGKTMAVYLKEGFCGFSAHLLQM